MSVWDDVGDPSGYGDDRPVDTAGVKRLKFDTDFSITPPFYFRTKVGGSLHYVDALPYELTTYVELLRFFPASSARTPLLTAQPISDTEILLSWEVQNLWDADEIVLEWGTGEAGPWNALTTQSIGVDGRGTYTHTGRSPNTNYWYRSRGKVAGALSPVSNNSWTSARTLTGAVTLTPPTNVVWTETGRTNTTVTYTISWDAVVGATGYEYYIDPDLDGGHSAGSQGSPINAGGTSVTGIVITRQINNDSCILYVRAKDAGGVGPYAVGVQQEVPGNLLPPTGTSATVVGTPADDVEIRYTESPSAVTATKYEVERNDGAGFFSLIASPAVGAAQPQYTDLNLADGTKQYRVRAVDIGPPVRVSQYSGLGTAVVAVSAPPPAAYDVGCDFYTFNDLTEIDALPNFSTPNPHRAFVDLSVVNGVGLKYLYRYNPICSQPNLTCKISNFGAFAPVLELCFEMQMKYDSVWTTAGYCVSCTCGGTDHKVFLAWAGAPSLGHRCDLRIGQENGAQIQMHGDAVWGGQLCSSGAGPGPGLIKQTSPIRASDLWNDTWFTVRGRWKLYNNPARVLTQLKINGTLTHSHFDLGDTDRTAADGFTQIEQMANRNHSPLVDMSVWVHHTYLYLNRNPGWFAGDVIYDYTHNSAVGQPAQLIFSDPLS